jgi:hypothetical protein
LDDDRGVDGYVPKPLKKRANRLFIQRKAVLLQADYYPKKIRD